MLSADRELKRIFSCAGQKGVQSGSKQFYKDLELERNPVKMIADRVKTRNLQLPRVLA